MIIYFLRHAEPLSRKSLNDREALNLGLSSYGKLQSKAAGKQLKKFNITKIFSSPIQRTKETAEIISRICDLPVEYRDELREFSPDFENRNMKEMSSFKREARLNPEKIFSSGESINQAVDRLKNFLKELDSHANESICIVTHRVLLESYLEKDFGINPGQSEWIYPASITALDFKAKKIIFINKRFRNTLLILRTVINLIR